MVELVIDARKADLGHGLAAGLRVATKAGLGSFPPYSLSQ